MSAKVEMKGKVDFVGDVETFSSGFSKRTFVVKDDTSKYEDILACELAKDRASLVQPNDRGRPCTVVGFVHSRKWTDKKTGKDKYFTSVDAVDVKFADGGAEQGGVEPKNQGDAKGVQGVLDRLAEHGDVVSDDMPF
jgi:single-strand DNA-binding protein